ncbi:putative DsbA family dithiol-disulfide isomerase [Peribacillus simplex]|uniref:DsbA family oxidoreductase n=1 Tax=Peribacillus simplex TaxID=1478 RepID=UPI0024E2673B|nr:DsbA family oxidoreductase [Peribacillus simplex]MDF9760099.1 putative DsbA family dithiol-disulfide isomerase [Peribacillus simplex]
MKVEIWSDYQCPFCYIGKRRFEEALKQFENKAQVEVSFRSFELNPEAERDINMSQNEMLAKKYGMSHADVEANNQNLTQQAKELGLEYHLNKVVLTNSFDAHRLMHFAESKGKENEMNELLFKAYFTEGKHIGDHVILANLAEEAGLDKSEAEAMLAGTAFTAEVRGDEQEGSQLGITGVPFFVINRKYGISGAQPTEAFLDTLKKIWAEENPLQMVNDPATGDACTDGSCNVPEK